VDLARLVDAWLARPEVKGAWLHLQGANVLSSHLGPALALGFAIHSSTRDSVHLGRWLYAGSPNKLPPGPSHSVGVGGMVVNRKHKTLLYVKEKQGPAVGRWKVPTGLVDAGEDLSAAVCREILEETGLHASMHHVVAFREMHGSTFGATNLFFMCLCVCDEKDEDKMPVSCEHELEAAAWLSVDDPVILSYYVPNTVYHELNRLALEAAKTFLFGAPSEAAMVPRHLKHRESTMTVYAHGEREPKKSKQ